MIEFAEPEMLLLLPAILPFFLLKQRSGGRIRYSNIQAFKNLKSYRRLWHPRSFLTAFRLGALVLFVVAMARPQSGKVFSETNSEGVDILLALDTSGSMQALDFKLEGKRVNRLTVVKKVVTDFVKKRVRDRMGLVVFGKDAFVQCPLTLDHGILLEFMKEVKLGMAGDATDIGSAIGAGVNRMKDLKSKSKVLILLTDGRSTVSQIPAIKAAEIAKSFGIKVYTIGVGTNGKAPVLVNTIFGQQYVYQEVDIDEDTLRQVAKITEAKYFRATDTKKLEEIYTQIDNLETTKVKVKQYTEYNEIFHLALLPGLLLLLLEIGLGHTVLRKIP